MITQCLTTRQVISLQRFRHKSVS